MNIVIIYDKNECLSRYGQMNVAQKKKNTSSPVDSYSNDVLLLQVNIKSSVPLEMFLIYK